MAFIHVVVGSIPVDGTLKSHGYEIQRGSLRKLTRVPY